MRFIDFCIETFLRGYVMWVLPSQDRIDDLLKKLI
jgi:hypothetical protein